MEGRRWEDMEADCLANIFQRLGLDDLTLVVPFVCKSWCRASRDPLCWSVLDFSELDFMPWSQFTKKFKEQYSLQQFSFSSYMKLIISRSCGSATELRFPLAFGASLKDLIYASNECPRLRSVVLPLLTSEDEQHIPELVGKWKDLERLELESKPSSFLDMVTQINVNCKNFKDLRMCGSVKEEDALAIVNCLPKIKSMELSRSYLPRKELLAIIAGCEELERLCVTDCIGFEADDEVIKRASTIKSFYHKGSKLMDDNGYETDDCDHLYVYVI